MELSATDVNFAIGFNLVSIGSYVPEPFDYSGYLEVRALNFDFPFGELKEVELLPCTKEYRDTYFNEFPDAYKFTTAYFDEGIFLCPQDPSQIKMRGEAGRIGAIGGTAFEIHVNRCTNSTETSGECKSSEEIDEFLKTVSFIKINNSEVYEPQEYGDATIKKTV